MTLMDLKNTTYFNLNRDLNIPLDDQINLPTDRDALNAFLEQNVAPNTMSFSSLHNRFDYLIDNDYLDADCINQYDFAFITSLYDYLNSQSYHFQSFMAAYTFYTNFALKTRDDQQYLETPIDHLALVALAGANGDEHLAMDCADELLHHRFQPATTPFKNAGRYGRGTLLSGFTLQIANDLNSIGRALNTTLQLSELGGDVSFNLTNISTSKEATSTSGGIVGIMQLIEGSLNYPMPTDDTTGVAYLNVFHPDILTFLATKQDTADTQARLKSLAIGIIIPDLFYELCRADMTMYCFSPADVAREYGMPFSEINLSAEYDTLVQNPRIQKWPLQSRELESKISQCQQESGLPYIVNIDTANKANPIDGQILLSDLNTSSFQIQATPELTANQDYLNLGRDNATSRATTNVGALMTSPDFGHSVETMVRAMTNVSDQATLATIPTVAAGNQATHTLGLSTMGLHSYFASQHLQYGTPETLEFTSLYFMLLNYWTLMASTKLARDRHQTFTGFENSDYASGVYFERYLDPKQPYQPQSEIVKRLFKHIEIPTIADWQALQQRVMQDGLYHQNRLAVTADTTTAIMNDTTVALSPIANRVTAYQLPIVGKLYYPAPGLSNATLPYYTAAYDTDMRQVIQIYAAAQAHVDQGLALPLRLRATCSPELYDWKRGHSDQLSTRDLSILRHYAHKAGLKSLYGVQILTETDGEFGANQCTSCLMVPDNH